MESPIELLEKGVYRITGKRPGGSVWELGPHWRLNHVIGSGTYGEVCSATDLRTNEEVALKRIENVLQSPQLAKCVLREVCIMRRLKHKNIIRLHDVFLHVTKQMPGWGEGPSDGGKLPQQGGSDAGTPERVDIYIATELAEKGDIYSNRGLLSEDTCRDMLRQLLEACAYMHANNVWHRDIKSANTLVTKDGTIKLCDFGLSRSSYTPAPAFPATSKGPSSNTSPSSGTSCVGGDDVAAGQAGGDPSPPLSNSLPTRPGSSGHSLPTRLGSLGQHATGLSRSGSLRSSSDGGGRGLCRVYTKMVVTPTYRAPEVIMSHGQYSGAIDMWALGCIFGELLWQQLEGHEDRWKQLHYKPTLFAYCGDLETPTAGQAYMLDSKQSLLKSQLDIIFNRIGTPGWSEIESVPVESWRKYLRGLQGRAGRLHKVLGRAGLEAVDLLQRLLTFDPTRRCSAREALAHVYFSDGRVLPGASDAVVGAVPSPNGRRWGLEPMVLQHQQERIDNAAWDCELGPSVGNLPFYAIKDPAQALAALEVELGQEVLEKERIQWLLQREVEGEQRRWARRLQIFGPDNGPHATPEAAGGEWGPPVASTGLQHMFHLGACEGGGGGGGGGEGAGEDAMEQGGGGRDLRHSSGESYGGEEAKAPYPPPAQQSASRAFGSYEMVPHVPSEGGGSGGGGGGGGGGVPPLPRRKRSSTGMSNSEQSHCFDWPGGHVAPAAGGGPIHLDHLEGALYPQTMPMAMVGSLTLGGKGTTSPKYFAGHEPAPSAPVDLYAMMSTFFGAGGGGGGGGGGAEVFGEGAAAAPPASGGAGSLGPRSRSRSVGTVAIRPSRSVELVAGPAAPRRGRSSAGAPVTRSSLKRGFDVGGGRGRSQRPSSRRPRASTGGTSGTSTAGSTEGASDDLASQMEL